MLIDLQVDKQTLNSLPPRGTLVKPTPKDNLYTITMLINLVFYKEWTVNQFQNEVETNGNLPWTF